MRGVPGVTGTLGKANSHFDPTQTGWGPHHHVEAAVDWYSSILLALHVHTTYTTEISHFTIQKNSIRVLRTDRKFVIMIRVKVNSKLQLVKNEERKSTLYGVICCCNDKLLSRAVICNHPV